MASPGSRLRRPPLVKALEAAGAIGGGRVEVLSGPPVYRAVVRSSGRPLEYTVAVAPSGRTVRAYSDDNGTLHRGYVGYPIIAVMMLAGLLPRDEGVEKALAGVNWYELNRKHRNYSKALEEVLTGLPPGLRTRAMTLARRVLEALDKLEVIYDPALARGEG